jgi:hypothetical protein
MEKRKKGKGKKKKTDNLAVGLDAVLLSVPYVLQRRI